jgi:hypothetical protein
VTHEVHVEASHRREEKRCPYCHGGFALNAAIWTCPGCHTPHHADCAKENGCCTVLGCRRDFSGKSVAPPRPVRMLPRGAPITDFKIGLVLLAIGAALNVLVGLTANDNVGALIIMNFYLPVIPIALICMLYALYRASNENRWRT